MSLRITQTVMFDRALENIRRNALQSFQAQQQISRGTRIQLPSDDPAALVRILPLRREIRAIEQDRDSKSTAQEALNLASSALEQASSLMADAKSAAVQGGNGTVSAADRLILADKIDQVIEEMLALANSKRGSGYLFSGSLTDEQPFVLEDFGGGRRVVYQGNDRTVDLEVAPGIETALYGPGDGIFLRRSRTATTFSGETGARAGSGTDNGVGFGRLAISHTGYSGLPPGIAAGATPATALGPQVFTVTAGAPPTISVGGGAPVPFSSTDTDLTVTTSAGTTVQLDLSAYTPVNQTGALVANARMTTDGGTSFTTVDFSSTNQPVHDSRTDTVLNVDATGITRTGTDDLKFGGTFDVFTSLLALRDALANTTGLGDVDAGHRISSLVKDLDSAHDAVLKGLQEHGGRAERLTLMGRRLDGLELTLTESLSKEQDTDVAAAILDLNKSDLTYRASLTVGARLLQTSLLDFLG